MPSSGDDDCDSAVGHQTRAEKQRAASCQCSCARRRERSSSSSSVSITTGPSGTTGHWFGLRRRRSRRRIRLKFSIAIYFRTSVRRLFSSSAASCAPSPRRGFHIQAEYECVVFILFFSRRIALENSVSVLPAPDDRVPLVNHQVRVVFRRFIFRATPRLTSTRTLASKSQNLYTIRF